MSRPAWAPTPGVHPQPGHGTAQEVADAHGTTVPTVRHYMRKRGMKRPPGPVAWEPEAGLRPRPGEAPDVEVAGVHRVSEKTVQRWRRRNGVGSYRRHIPEGHLRIARDMRREGKTYREIARALGTTCGSVWRMLHG